MSEENPQETKLAKEVKKEKAARAKSASNSSRSGSDMCACGHRASMHTANRYLCRAPGKVKGYCPCMKFAAKRQSK